jgi:hypothetical protein
VLGDGEEAAFLGILQSYDRGIHTYMIHTYMSIQYTTEVHTTNRILEKVTNFTHPHIYIHTYIHKYVKTKKIHELSEEKKLDGDKN